MYLDLAYTNMVLVGCCLAGFLYAIFNAVQLRKVDVKPNAPGAKAETNFGLILETASFI
jgi:hypothetical protein